MKKLILLAMMLAAPGAFGQRSISVSTNGMPAPSSAWGIQSAPTNLVWTGVHEDRSTRTNTAAGKVEFQGGFRVTTVATNENLRTPGWAQIGTMTNTVSFRAEGGFTVTGIATQGNARVTGWLELGGQFTNMSGILVASNITVALSASPPAGKIGLVASNNTWWLVTSAGVWTDLASGGSGVDATKVSTNNGIAYNLTNRESFRVEGGSTFIGISTQANTRITGSAFIQAGTNVDFTATSTSIGSSTTGVARVTGGLSSVGGTTNQGTAPTHQAAPLLVSGAFITVPVTNTALTVNLATNLAQAYTTNASYDVAFTGTALNGTRVEYRIWNTGATNIRVGIPGSFSIQAGAGITDITAVSNSLTRVIWTIIGGSNYVEVAGADQYQLSLGPNAAVGQPLEIMSLNGGLGGRMIITNGNDDVGAAGAVIRWQSNTVTIGSQTNFNIISTNHAEFGLLGTNNTTTGSADIHGYIGSAIARDAEVFGWLAGSNFATFANIQSSNYVDRTELANSNYVTAAAVFATDNRVLRSDGTGRGSQSSGLVIDDSANLGGIRNASITNAITNINGIMQFGGVRLEYQLVDGLPSLDVLGGARMLELMLQQTGDVGKALFFEDGANGSDKVTIQGATSISSNYTIIWPPNAPPSATQTNLTVTGISGSTVSLGWASDNVAAPAGGDAAMANATAVSDSFTITNLAPTASTPGSTVAITPGTDPDPDKIAVQPSVATATLAGAVTAIDQTFAGVKFFTSGISNTWYRGSGNFTNEGDVYANNVRVGGIYSTNSSTNALNEYVGGELLAASAQITNNITYHSANLIPTGNATNFQADYTFAWRTILMTNAVRFTGVVNTAAANLGKAYIAKLKNTSGGALRVSVDAGFRRSGTNDVSVANNQNADVLITPDGTGGANPTNHTAQIILYDSP